MEVAGLVWVLKKVRHLIESSGAPTIIYTDHGATLGIARQTTLSTSSTDKLNLRLVRASNYIQRFPLIILHKPGKLHIVPDASSRLPSNNSETTTDHEGELDVLFTAAMVEIDDDFLKKIVEGYKTDSYQSLKNPR